VGHINVWNIDVSVSVDSNVMQSVKQAFGSDDKKEMVDPFFVFGFAGREVCL